MDLTKADSPSLMPARFSVRSYRPSSAAYPLRRGRVKTWSGSGRRGGRHRSSRLPASIGPAGMDLRLLSRNAALRRAIERRGKPSRARSARVFGLELRRVRSRLRCRVGRVPPQAPKKGEARPHAAVTARRVRHCTSTPGDPVSGRARGSRDSFSALYAPGGDEASTERAGAGGQRLILAATASDHMLDRACMNRTCIRKIDRRLAAAGVDQHSRVQPCELALQLGDVVERTSRRRSICLQSPALSTTHTATPGQNLRLPPIRRKRASNSV
jgi:hypothetical protein